MKNTAQRTAPSGFTLIELLAVIAIIGTLIGLLLPAIQRARESGRNMQCVNNLKQMGVALSNYEQAKKRYPPGNDQLGNRLHAWSSFILPFLEQSAVSDRIDYTKPWDDPASNLSKIDITIPTYVCPSGVKQFPGKQDYGGILGAYIKPNGEALNPLTTRDEHGGILYATDADYKLSATAASVSDGLSKTLLVAEAVDREMAGGADTHTYGDACWACGNNCFPLNSRVINDPTVDAFRSLHSGGLNSLYGDGHTSFLSDRLDVRVLIAICTRTGGETETEASN
jgi:prepilin-type N-terminal cleavage/methylation domain-containing protein/prepilin-type processing-associated H-X9-DG protein